MKRWRLKGTGTLQEHQQQREEMFKQFEQDKTKKKKFTILVISLICVILLIGIGSYTGYYVWAPGDYDNFASCLTEKGAVMYGAINWCKYTQAQANMFGKSFEFIDYRDEAELSGIRKRPTWVIDRQWYEGVQSFEHLSALTGCSLG